MYTKLMRYFFQLFLSIFRVKQGPLMFQVREEYWFIDYYGQIWVIRYTGQHDIPFSISIHQK